MWKDSTFSRTKRLSVAPLMKPSALRQPLSVMSGHPAAIHFAWLQAYLQRLRRHSSQLSWYESSRQVVIERLLEAGVDRIIVDHVYESSHACFPVVLPVLWLPDRFRNRDKYVWLPLPYHPIWTNRINASLAALNFKCSVSIQSNFGVAGFKAAWKLTSPTLSSLVRLM